MLTSGTGFEGYEVVGYLGFVNGQTAVGSRLFQDLPANIAEMSSQESSTFTSKLQQVSESALEKLCEITKAKGANAVIGVALNYTDFSSNSVGTVASGTAVRIKKIDNSSHTIKNELYVTNYYNKLIPRPVKVVLKGEHGKVKISPIFYNYNSDEIKVVRADIELTNYFDEKLILQGIDFVFEKNNVTVLEADFVECKLPEKDIKIIKEAKIYIRKYVSSRGIMVCNDIPIDIKMTMQSFEGLKQKRGLDAVERYKSDGSTWLCNCGYINAAGDEECIICGRKESELRKVFSFNYEGMVNRMKTKNNAIEIKDVLMEYIKEIDSKYRMELLEIMESALQYEKTRGNMKETVIEKIERVFEGN